jgi:polypeptide N-acetylgalactosaminyltransferase
VIFFFIIFITFKPDQQQEIILKVEAPVKEEIKRSSEKSILIEVIQNQIFIIKPPPNIFGENVTLGEDGNSVTLPENIPEEIQKLIDIGIHDHQFNQYVSDLISVNRNIKDQRMDACKNINYFNSSKLPSTSIIITFHNEAWSTLLRTVHSIINQSPHELIEEIILVDDFSNMRE